MPTGIATATNAFQAGGSLKLGTSSAVGSFTTQPVEVGTAPSISVSFRAIFWAETSTPKPSKVEVKYGTLCDTVIIPVAQVNWPLNSDIMSYFSVTFPALSTPTAIEVSTIVENGVEPRVLMDNFRVSNLFSPAPLTQGFESETFPPDGWLAINQSGATRWRRYTASSNTGNACARVNSTQSIVGINWLITPQLMPTALQNSLSFYVRVDEIYQAPDSHLRILVSQNEVTYDDFSDTLLVLFSYDLTRSWIQYTVDLSAYEGRAIYIAFQVKERNGSEFWIDDVIGPSQVLSNCPPPISMNKTNITANSVDLDWSDGVVGGSGADYVIEYSISPTFEHSIETKYVEHAISTTITNLEPNTTYYVRAKANCFDGFYNEWGTQTSFLTACGVVSQGFSENFADIQEFDIPRCWTSAIGRPNKDFNVHVLSGEMHMDGYSINNPPLTMLATPQFANINIVEATFRLKGTSPANATFEVGVMSDLSDRNNFHLIQNVTPTNTDWNDIHVQFADAPSNHKYIVFRMTTTNGTSMYKLDDFVATILSTCPKPTDVAVSDITSDNASIGWNASGSESEWVIEYKRSNATEWTEADTVTASPYTLANLVSGTAYEVRVKAICTPSTDESLWSETATFTTTCGVEELPYIEDFENVSTTVFPPTTCWNVYSILAAEVFAGTATLTESNNSYWKYSDNNSGIATGKALINIRGTDRKDWLVSPVIALSGANKELTFDLAYTKHDTSDSATTNGGDDKFMVIISADGGNTWTADNATVWANDQTGNHLLNQITNGPNHINIDLSAYSGNIRIAFYAESTAINASNDLHLDNIVVHQIEIPTVVTLAADAITQTTATLHQSVTDGTYPVTAKGFYYRPAGDDNLWEMTSDSTLTDLTAGTTYEFYAFAIANGATYKGETLEFSTEQQMGIEHADNKTELYPNPTTEMFVVSQSGRLEVFTVSGQKVYSEANYKAGIPVNISNLAKGSYIVRINENKIKLIVR